MKDYIYYIPGYTGFCPDLPNHFGDSYGKATHQIIRQRPIDLLRERLSDVRYGERKRGTYYSAYHGDHYHNSKYADCYGGRPCSDSYSQHHTKNQVGFGQRPCCDSCCQRRTNKYTGHDQRACCDSCCRYCRKDECIYKLPKNKEFSKGKAEKQASVQSPYLYCEGYVVQSGRRDERPVRVPPKGGRPCCDTCCDWKSLPGKQFGTVQDHGSYVSVPSVRRDVRPARVPTKGGRPCCDTCCDWKSLPGKQFGMVRDHGCMCQR